MTAKERKILRRSAEKIEKILKYSDFEMKYRDIIADMLNNSAKEVIKALAYENNGEAMESLGLPVALVVAVDVYWFKNIDGKEV